MKRNIIKVSAWGNSLGVRLPKSVVEELGIEADTSLVFEVRNGQIILRPESIKYRKSDYVEEAIQLLYRTLPQSSEILSQAKKK